MLTVTTPADVFDLVDITLVHDILGLEPDTVQDEKLAGFIHRASDVIARHCHRTFAEETVEETFRLDCYGQMELVLARYPVSSISSIAEGGVALSATDYEADLAKGIVTRLHNDRPCFWSRQKIVATYVTGYDLPDAAPEALQQAALQLVKSYYLGADRDPMIRAESVTPVSSASYFGAAEYLPPDVVGLLNQFRNVRAR